MVLILVAGLFLVGLGIAGIRYAPAILEAQRERGAAPVRSETVDDDDRLRATRGVGVAFAVLGTSLVAYSIF